MRPSTPLSLHLPHCHVQGTGESKTRFGVTGECFTLDVITSSSITITTSPFTQTIAAALSAACQDLARLVEAPEVSVSVARSALCDETDRCEVIR
jgi:hypothetical protein